MSRNIFMENKYIYSTKEVNTVEEYISAFKDGYLYISYPASIDKQLLNKLRELKDTSDELSYAYCVILSIVEEDKYISEEYYRYASKLVESTPYFGEYLLGDCYYYGFVVEKNEDKALEHYLIAAKYGNALAQNAAGFILKNNPKDDYSLQDAIGWFESAANQDLANAQCNLADCYYRGIGVKENDPQAFHWYLKAAKQGNDIAMNMTGVCYEFGYGVDEDPVEAFNWYQKGAENGNTNAKNNLGRCYKRGYGTEENIELAIHWYEESAEEGNTYAMDNLGDCYRLGIGVNKDPDKAFYWYKKAAEEGNEISQDELGYCYEVGIGTEINLELAFYWYHKSAEQEYPRGQRHLGVCYENGIYVEEDMSQAFVYYLKAAEQGDEIAMDYVGECYRRGDGVEANPELAFEWYKKSAEAEYDEGLNDLAYCYEKGIGVDKKPELAYECYKKSAELGNTDGENSLGRCFEYGIGVELNPKKAFHWYRVAAEKNNKYAQYNIARCYESGFGTQLNERMAFYWYKKSADNDYFDAKRAVIYCYSNGFGVPEDKPKAFRLTEELANTGNLEALNGLAICYEDGDGTEKDEKKAFELYEKGAKEGNYLCQYNLARCYRFGIGTEIDENKAFSWYLDSANNDYGLAQWQLGACYEDGIGIAVNYEKAFYWYQRAVDNGETRAENSLARCYDDGIGTEADPKSAFYWYQESAEHGDDNGAVNLGVCYELGIGTEPDIFEAVHLYEEAAKNGNEVGQCNLAWCYENGTEATPQDYKMAIYWYEKAIEKDYDRAYLNLSIIYYYGNGCDKDPDKCFIYAKKAADLGNPTAMNNLGFYYENGVGTPIDNDKAMEYYSKAAELKEGIACNNLGESYYNGVVTNKDLKKAFYWYQKGAELGYPLSFYNVGYCLANGEGTAKNERLALRWFRKGAEKYNEENCQFMVATYYYNGTVEKKDDKLAFEWAYKAAEQGQILAQNNVGFFFEEGLGGVPKDISKAIYWYELAANQGLDDACDSLYKIYLNEELPQYDLNKALYWLKKYEEVGGASCKDKIEELERKIEEENHRGLIVDQNIDIFISWNHNNADVKESIKKALEDNNIKIWESDSKSRGKLDDNVSYAINKAKGYIIILSKEALSSTYIPQEIEMIFSRIRRDKLSNNVIKIIALDPSINDSIALLDDSNSIKKLIGFTYDFTGRVENAIEFAKERITEYLILNYQIKLKEQFDVFSISLSDETIHTRDNISISSFIKFEDGFINRSLIGPSGERVDTNDILNCKNQVLIYGEGGSGKSLYVKNIIRRNVNKSTLFFYLPCSQINNAFFKKEDLDLYELISDICFKFAKCETLPAGVIKNILEGEEKKVIIVDALDEAEQNKEKIVKIIAKFGVLNSKSRVHFIYTTRDKSDANMIARITEKEVYPLFIRALEDEDILSMFDAIYKKNENKISEGESEKSIIVENISDVGAKEINKMRGASTALGSSFSGISRRLFEQNLKFLADDIKKNPLLISNLIYIYLATNKLPQQKYEVLEESNKVMINSSISSQKSILMETTFKNINELLEIISFRLAINYQKENDLVKIIKSVLKGRYKAVAYSDSGLDILFETKAQAIYDYLRQRQIVVGNKIAHDIYADYFTANYIFKNIYDTEAENDIGKIYLGFHSNGLNKLEEFMSDDEFLSCNFNPWVEVTMDFIAKLDYEAKKLMPEYNERYLSYPTFNMSLERLFRRDGISDNAYKILLDIIKKDIDDKEITFFNYAEEIIKFMKR